MHTRAPRKDSASVLHSAAASAAAHLLYVETVLRRSVGDLGNHVETQIFLQQCQRVPHLRFIVTAQVLARHHDDIHLDVAVLAVEQHVRDHGIRIGSHRDEHVERER